jgi:hypothetical protein
MELLNALKKNQDVEFLANVLVGLLFGWQGDGLVENKEEDELEQEVLNLLVRNSGIGAARAHALVDHHGPALLLRILAESDVEQLEAVAGIGDKLSEKLVRGLSWLARDLACRYEDILVQQACRPLYEQITEDTETEREFEIATFTADEHGFPVVQKETICDDVTDCGCPWFTLSGNSTTRGWSGVPPYEVELQKMLVRNLEAPQGACGAHTAQVVDWERSGCGFLPEELTGSGKLDQELTSIVWKHRKDEKRKRAQRFTAWMEWLKKDNVNLRAGATKLRSKYFEHRKLGSIFLTQLQMNQICEVFAQKGQNVWPNRK